MLTSSMGHRQNVMTNINSSNSSASPFAILCDIVVDPENTLARIANRPQPWIAFAVFIGLLISGEFLQAPVTHHVMYLDDVANGTLKAGTSETDVAVSILQDVVNWTINAIFLTLGVLLSSLAIGLSTLIWGTRVGRKAIVAITFYISAVTIGVSYVITGLLFRILGVGTFANDVDLERGMPSMLMLAPSMPQGFVSAALSAINPFFLLSVILYASALSHVGAIRDRRFTWLIAMSMALGGIFLRGIMGAIIGY